MQEEANLIKANSEKA